MRANLNQASPNKTEEKNLLLLGTTIIRNLFYQNFLDEFDALYDFRIIATLWEPFPSWNLFTEVAF
jgi:hypothetical protein